MSSPSSGAPTQVGICDAAVIAAAFSPDKTQLAFSPNNHLVHIVDIASTDCRAWAITATLSSHEQAVTGIDWNATTGKILTCAHDRSAFVWEQKKGKKQWEPVLILLDSQIKRGLTCAAWCPHGQKLYEGSAATNIAIGKYDAESDWWQCTVVTPHCSGLTALAPHPINPALLATGANDCCIKLVSTFTKSVDPADMRLGKAGAELGAFQMAAWVQALTWAPSGTAMAAATRDSCVCVLSGEDFATFDNWVVRVISLRGLPCRSVAFLADDVMVAGGHDFYPLTFKRAAAVEEEDPAGGWAIDKVGVSPKKEQKELTVAQKAKLKFQNQATFGQETAVEMPDTRHSNTIVSVLPLAGAKGEPTASVPKATAAPLLFATASLDGKVELWGAADLVPPQ